MAQYNLSYAETSSKGGSDEQANRYVTDKSVVETVHVDEKKVMKQAFTEWLAMAMNTFFDCQSYHQFTPARNSLEMTFFGVAHNTTAAAMAFEMCFNLISQWAMEKHGKSAKHSYSLGVAEGLCDIANSQKTARARENGM